MAARDRQDQSDSAAKGARPVSQDGATDIARFMVAPSATLRDVMQCIDENGIGIAIVVDEHATFLNLVTDGDVRRALLGGMDLAQPIEKILQQKAAAHGRGPVTARVEDPPDFILLLMERLNIHQIPLLDGDGRLKRVVHRDALATKPKIAPGHAALIMAGGFGTRLRPLTDTTPKPMLPVAGRPMVEHSVRRLVQAGIEKIYMSVHYLPDIVTSHFGDGRKFGCAISYLYEDKPLGTAGAVRNAPIGTEPLLVMNGDVMTGLNFTSLIDFHKRNNALITVAAAPYEVGVPYGVLNVDGVDVVALEEKPTKRFFINTGIYVLSPEACQRIPLNTKFDMTDLIEQVMADRGAVKVYAMHEYWRDIGRLEDLQRVNAELGQGGLIL